MKGTKFEIAFEPRGCILNPRRNKGPQVAVQPLGWLAKFADILMVPFMYVISGTLKETPQRGHRWNNKRLSQSDVKNLDISIMVHCKGMDRAMRSRWLFLFHIPILGGWRNYVVLETKNDMIDWHVGYIADDMVGVSRIRLSGRVRMLIGSGDVSFFGIDANSFEQLSIREIGRGRIGEGGSFAREILL